MAIRAVLFDLFDTLVDLRLDRLPRRKRDGSGVHPSLRALHEALCESAEVDFQRFASSLREVDREIRDTRYQEGREVSTQERFQAVLGRLGLEEPARVERLTAVHMEILRGTVEVPGHHAGLLADLGERLPLGLCSNFTHSATAVAILEEGGMRGPLRAIAISDAVGWRKPRGEIFAAVLAELGTAPEETLHVGDNLRADVAGAAALGLRTAWLTRRVEQPERQLRQHEGPPPDFTIADLAELPALLGAEE